MSYADQLFVDMCKDIIENGTDTKGEKVRPKWEDGTPAYTIKKFGVVNRYDLRKEFPALTLRKTALKSAMDEILWIYQRKSNEIEDLKSSIWDEWSTPVTNNKELVFVKKVDFGPFDMNNLEKINIHPILPHNVASEKESKNCGKYFLIEKEDKKYKIQFINTGNIKTVTDSHYYSGTIFDEYARHTYGIGYYGKHKSPEILEYFGEYFDRWVDIWRHVIKRCNPKYNIGTKYEGCTVSPYFQCCENFLRWVMENNRRDKRFLGIASIDKDYFGDKCYSERTCCLLLPKENTSLTLKKWFFYQNRYFFSKEDLVKHIENETGLSFVIYDKHGERVGVSSSFRKHLEKMIENKEVIIIDPHMETDEGFPRFSLNDRHSIGTAYGYVIGTKFKYKNEMIDQMDYVLKQLKETPYSRRIMTNMYQFDALATGNLDPCCYSCTYNVTKEENSDKLVLNMVLNQRSQDILAANNWNVAQYAILLMMVAQVNDMIPGELIHVIADAHIYNKHVPIIKELIAREQYPAPKVRLNPEVKNFYDFTTNDLIVEDYVTGPQVKNIPIAV